MTNTTNLRSIARTGLFTLLAGFTLAGANELQAQLPQVSATALGMGDNMTASARGFAAVANNPAGLAHWDSPGFSLALAGGRISTGIGPITFSDLVEFEGQVVPNAVKEEWLTQVADAGGLSGVFGAGATPFALNIGPVGFQLSTVAGDDLTLGPDATELLLYGNAGRTGTPRDFDLVGSSVDAFVLSTAAVSLGFRATDRFYVGATGKYTMGNGLLVGRDAGSIFLSEPISVDLQFPFLASVPLDEDNPNDPEFDHGTGFGLDLGVIWEGPGITLGARVENVVNTFEWSTENFYFSPGEAVFDENGNDSDFEEQPASAAPAEILSVVDQLTLKPVYSVGAEITLPLVRLQADVRQRVTGGLELGPEFHAGVGAELTALGFLPIRAHTAVITDGFQVGGGASLILGPVNLTVGAALRTGELQDQTLGMVTLSFGGN